MITTPLVWTTIIIIPFASVHPLCYRGLVRDCIPGPGWRGPWRWREWGTHARDEGGPGQTALQNSALLPVPGPPDAGSPHPAGGGLAGLRSHLPLGQSAPFSFTHPTSDGRISTFRERMCVWLESGINRINIWWIQLRCLTFIHWGPVHTELKRAKTIRFCFMRLRNISVKTDSLRNRIEL